MTIGISIALGFLTLILGAAKDFGPASDDAVTALGVALLALGAVAQFLSMRRDMAPILARRGLRVAVVAAEPERAAAESLVARLRSLGYRRVDISSAPAACDVVVLYRPLAEHTVSLVQLARDTSPGAHIAVYSHAMIRELRLSDSLTAANSTMRLIGDLGAIAEMRGGR